MKYIKPSTEIIKLGLTDNIAEDVIIHGSGPQEGGNLDPNAARKHFMVFDDDDDYGNIQNAGSHTSLWDEE